MVGEGLSQVYYRFKLNFYRKVFYSLQKKEDTLTTIETFFVELIYALDHPTVNEVSSVHGSVSTECSLQSRKSCQKRIR